MSTEETRQLAHNYLDVLNRVMSTGDLDLLDGIASAGIIEHGGTVGLESWKQDIAMRLSAFPDAKLIAKMILADGNMAVIHATLQATHLGELDGMPPTGNTISVDHVDIVRFEEGQAVERWIVGDEMGMLQQLGMMPEPGA